MRASSPTPAARGPTPPLLVDGCHAGLLPLSSSTATARASSPCPPSTAIARASSPSPRRRPSRGPPPRPPAAVRDSSSPRLGPEHRRGPPPLSPSADLLDGVRLLSRKRRTLLSPPLRPYLGRYWTFVIGSAIYFLSSYLTLAVKVFSSWRTICPLKRKTPSRRTHKRGRLQTVKDQANTRKNQKIRILHYQRNIDWGAQILISCLKMRAPDEVPVGYLQLRLRQMRPSSSKWKRYWALQQGSSSSCRTADAAAWDPAQQQKRQRCQGSSSSSDQAGSSTSNPLQISKPEKQDLGSGEIEEEEEEDYYMEDDCDDDEGYDEDEYEFDQADFNQHLADKFDGMDLPPGVEATVPWLQKIAPKEQDDGSSAVNTEDENTKKLNQFKQFDTVQNFSDHHFAQHSEGEPSRVWSKRIQHDWKLLEKDLPG
ncbi:hypothetical protein PR202_gb27246 [Eleusine coracana subsp. coracana]|uniref:Uncharacterized protein n=1 Tax=Eleusine coracana subsp. coracana TaxID=191504 RepID=A0AAV5FTQ9_ELECO|nr:hypothetical protein PR202_gb27246 [Eleusine coracana subsp. coracana]